MSIKKIFDEISALSGDKAKMAKLEEYSTNELLREVLYLTCSKRIKFYIKQIPEYTPDNDQPETLEWALQGLDYLINRTYTGNKASGWLQTLLNALSADDAYILERIISKDAKLGMGTTFINKVIPGLIEKTPYMGCVPFDIKKAKALFKDGYSVLSEVKADGRYVNVIIRGGEVEMESRQGEATILGDCPLIRALSNFDDCVLNGELVMNNDNTRLINNGIISSLIDFIKKQDSRTTLENQKKYDAFLKEKGLTLEEAQEQLRLKVWDVIQVEDYYNMKSSTIREARLEHLESIVDDNDFVSIVEHKYVSSFEEAMQHFTEVLEKGEEGTVLKSIKGTWANGKPTHQIKLKLEMNLDLKITGFNYGKKGTKNENVISSIECRSSCGKLVANAQGLTEKLMDFVTENQYTLKGSIIEVKCNGISSNSNGGYSVYYPALSDFRNDKSEANSLEECIEIQESILGLK